MTEGRLATYLSDAHRYDELLDGRGHVRPHWRPLIDALTGDGAELARRGVEQARRLIVENGVTYNVYADPQGRDRAWVLDPLPVLLTAAEWEDIEAGVAQRARLFDALLADLYGPQKLLMDGTIPPQLPFGHPNFLWPCHGLQPAGGNWLRVYAVDISRSADGQWWALADRTQAPSGPGYALENRQIVSRIFPELLRDVGVRPLNGFFVALRDSFLRAAAGDASQGDALRNEESTGDHSPHAVVLTPGSFNETYFEHAYLARQLGLPLVEGHDLTVRGDTVYLKTLGGLRRVHAILRRLDDDFCDPVELRADSALGVPGLIGVVRAGRVVLGNALGSGVLESAAWMGFMPTAAERLLGEKLRLPSVATWWCGEPLALDYVLQNLGRLVVKPAYPNQKFEPVFGRNLDAAQRAELSARVRAKPHAYVAQERLAFSQAPVWRGAGASIAGQSGFAARALGIRVYAIATPSGYRVMPGGLARIAGDMADIVSMQRGGGSKDVWVLSADRKSADDATAVNSAPRISRHDDLPSRLAENLFWLGRYAERCDGKARLVRATLSVRANVVLWTDVLQSCKRIAGIEKLDAGMQLFDESNSLGLRADLQRLGWCADQARSKLSAENWRALGVMQRDFQDAGRTRRDPRETLDTLLLSLAALAGFALDDMTQDDGWRLMMIGRRLERMYFLAELLAQRLESGNAPTQAELEWLLDIGDSTITYRTRYLASPRLGETLDLLVFDQSNPRGLAFQWHAIELSLVRLAASLGGAPDDTLDEAVALVQGMQLAGVDGSSARAQRARQSLAEQLNVLAAAAHKLSDRLSLKYFSMVELELRTVAA
jgi:uncharacterized circularly permuted ATP-grasp superfamily protein/uncharacterized alpha-E superfamily protein